VTAEQKAERRLYAAMRRFQALAPEQQEHLLRPIVDEIHEAETERKAARLAAPR